MFDFNSVEAPKKLNRDFILSKISDSMIFGYYFGPFRLGDVYPSKFHRDRNPSTGFYTSTSGKLIYNHLNNKEPKMDCFAFVSRLYNLSFSDTIKRIALDFSLISGNPTPISDKTLSDLRKFDKQHKEDTKIHFVAEKWNSENFAFWKDYHITVRELKSQGVYPIKKLYINEMFIPNKNNCQRYALTVPVKDEMLVKVYSPGGEDTLKWVSNIPLDRPFGVDTLDWTAPFSFGAKAQKDRIVLMKFLPAVYATQNENPSSFSDKFKKKLKFHFRRNCLGWDNDETGIDGMIEMGNQGFDPVYVYPEYLEQYNIKDFSDMAKEKGLKAVEQLLKENDLI